MLLSINPKFVREIFAGNKQYEFRKQRCKQPVDTIIIYATSPIMQVVGEADVVDIIEDSPEQIWSITSKEAGISKIFYDTYYAGKEKAIAYKLGKVKLYDEPLSLSDLGVGSAPQSYMYL